ncbi:MAG: DUF3768 domain-containing protein [Pseudolabrys sp.]|nr:DUF3768 domain-containing protein [Pseudolabrys sp.]MCW5696131.1 DUF3768 domain-containing protein [Bauldia sp.]
MTSLSHLHRAARIRGLNDRFRADPDPVAASETFILTFGRISLPYFIEQVRNYEGFTPGDDYAEHETGAFDVADHQVYWFIDYLTPDLRRPSTDPADPAKTRRVLRFALAEELNEAA